MPKIRFLHFIKAFIHITLIGAIFLILVASLDNKNTMIITMHAKSGNPVETEFYYTKVGKPFGDNKMSRRYKIHGDQYFFRMPDFSEINFARLDPAKHIEDITINDIQIITSNWFHTTVYSADIKKSELGQQITDYQILKNGVHFKTTGRDSYLLVNLTRKLEYTSRNLHINTFLMALLLYAVLLFVYQIYRTKEHTPQLHSKLILYGIFLAFSLFKVDYYKEHVHYTYTPDMVAHLSYIEYLHHHHEVLPKFENMYMITNKNAGNYLGHPPLYYYFMEIVYDPNLSIGGNVENFRTLNTIIFLAGILLMFYMGFMTKFSTLAHFAYLTVITSIPMHAYLGSSVTNDNLAIFGGILFMLGLLRLIQKNYTTMSYVLIGLGMFIAYFSKLTAALLIFFALIAYIYYMYKTKTTFTVTKKQMMILVLFSLPILIYQAHIMLYYHTLVPTLNATHPEEYKHSVYFIPPLQREYQTLVQWFANYWSNIHSGWFGIHSFHSLVKLSILNYIGLFILHIFALIALFKQCTEENRAFCTLGKLTIFGLFSVMIVQFTFSYLAHLKSGYMGGLQVRYLLPFMASFAIMASVFVERFNKYFLFTVFVIILCLQALYSDFFYFLKYYI